MMRWCSAIQEECPMYLWPPERIREIMERILTPDMAGRHVWEAGSSAVDPFGEGRRIEPCTSLAKYLALPKKRGGPLWGNRLSLLSVYQLFEDSPEWCARIEPLAGYPKHTRSITGQFVPWVVDTPWALLQKAYRYVDDCVNNNAVHAKGWHTFTWFRSPYTFRYLETGWLPLNRKYGPLCEGSSKKIYDYGEYNTIPHDRLTIPQDKLDAPPGRSGHYFLYNDGNSPRKGLANAQRYRDELATMLGY